MSKPGRGTTLRLTTIFAAAAAAAVVAAGCTGPTTSSASGSNGGGNGGAAAPKPSPTAPAAVVTTRPGNGTTGVSPQAKVGLTVAHGTLRSVQLTNPSGALVKGSPSADRRTWTSTEVLGYGKTYTWSGSVVGAGGKVSPVSGRFTTVTPKTILHAEVNIGDHESVGIAAPIIVTFDGHVSNRAAAERELSVHTSVPTEGSWAWEPDQDGQSTVHWRPHHYWKPDTKVSFAANLYGVDYGNGVYGKADFTSKFQIGRSQITKADVNSHRLIVLRNGKEIFNFPASYGLGSDPNRNTRNGIHITMEKYRVKYMSNPAYGYVDVPENWAVRISNNGEFIHENPETVGIQGSENITHGCVNLSEASAHAYYDSSLYGDPVEVTNSPIELSAADGDVYDWTVPWSKWQSMSALH